MAKAVLSEAAVYSLIINPTICFSKTHVTGTYPESKKLLLLGKFGFCNCGSKYRVFVCLTPLFWVHYTGLRELQGGAQFVHVTYQGCGLV